MNEFKTYHPIVNFIYFTAAIGFSMVFMHPVCICISLVCSLSYSIVLKRKRAVKFLMYMLPLFIAAALINPAFNHEGVTILTYLPSGNPLTLESIFYGLAAAGMTASVIVWFSCFNEIMTSDKFIYLSGRIMPSFSLILSMVFRFVPRFKAQIKTISDAQKCIGRDVSDGSIAERAENGIKILSIMITLSLENAIETADSMKSRGYGLPGRTAFSNYKFSRRDISALIYIILLALYVLLCAASGSLYFSCFPSMKGLHLSAAGISAALSYFMLCITPIVIEGWEAYKWKSLKSKI